jgi:hypothetical protein
VRRHELVDRRLGPEGNAEEREHCREKKKAAPSPGRGANSNEFPHFGQSNPYPMESLPLLIGQSSFAFKAESKDWYRQMKRST